MYWRDGMNNYEVQPCTDFSDTKQPAKSMLHALKQYLTDQGYNNIYLDMMPDISICPDAISLGKWDHTVGSINDGTGCHYIQIQARRRSYDDAYAACSALFNLLDSGDNEQLINLTYDYYCIARPNRGPLLMSRSDGYTTIYCEVVLWGKN